MIQTLLLGITQGLTEFLPISSSGHLVLMQRMFQGLGPLRPETLEPFFVFLHSATLLVIALFLLKRVRILFSAQFFPHVFLITFITGCVALGIRHYFHDNLFGNKFLLALCFLVNAGILLSVRNDPRQRKWQSISWKDSVIIGILQGIAFMPGISRSGITITGFLKRGFSKEEAFMLSFLIGIPAIAGAFFVECGTLMQSKFPLSFLAMGFVSAGAAGFLTLGLLRRMVIADKFRNFAYYCLALSLVTLFV